jgi:predicted nucleic acid-binding protein
VAYLVDTSVLARLANAVDPLRPTAARAIVQLDTRGEILYVTAQSLIEFRNVATRPTALNGLGLSVAEAEAEAASFESTFLLLQETPDIYPAWKALAMTLAVIGKQVHDARLVAVCHVHGVTHLLTFNTTDFTRFSSYGPGLIVVDPATV